MRMLTKSFSLLSFIGAKKYYKKYNNNKNEFEQVERKRPERKRKWRRTNSLKLRKISHSDEVFTFLFLCTGFVKKKASRKRFTYYK